MTAGTIHFRSHYLSRQHIYNEFVHGPFVPQSLELMNLLGEKTYNAIVVYPEAVYWEPNQRPHQMLRELAKRGYLCFFCESTPGPFGLREVEPNLFIVNGDKYLLSVLRSQSVIVLCSWLVQMAWADFLPHKTLWYDVLDQLEFFSLYDDQMLQKHNEIVEQADIVTYSAQALHAYVASRSDAVLLPNATRSEDFLASSASVPEDLAPIIAKGSPVIGYFGAIEEWFDADLLEALAAKRPDWQFVLIGKFGMDNQRLQAPNIHLLGMKPYRQLAQYGQHFDVAIIPFLVNDLTNSVSPVKFFEYASLGLTVVSTPIAEIKPLQSDWVFIAEGMDGFERAIIEGLKPDAARRAKEAGRIFANQNQWAARAEQLERCLMNKPAAWQAYANYDATGKIAVMATTFLDFDGEKFYSGGAERYLMDLFQLFKQKGYQLAIYQYGNSPWIRRFRGVDVVSLSRGGQHAKELSISAVKIYNRLFQEQTAERSILNVYSAFFNAWPYENGKASIGIIHGVAWDNPASHYVDGHSFWETNRRFIEGARLCESLVSVDNNSANWFQTVDYSLRQRIKVIANYVDPVEFSSSKDDKQDDRIVILYPRRLYHARGLHLVLQIIDEILIRYPHVDFHFVGQGEDEDIRMVMMKMNRWPGRIKTYSLPFDRMPQAYKQADISVIPTLYSEGTSLSCLEAMSCGNAVIATRVGGLSDLVIHEYNGLLIEPHAHALKEAITDLIENPSKLALFKQRAEAVSLSFSKQSWVQQWSKLIDAVLQKKQNLSIARDKSLLIDVYLSSYPQNDGIGKTIIRLLNQGNLVYVKLKSLPAGHMPSFGRLQWLNWNAVSHSNPDLVIADEAAQAELNLTAHARFNEGGDLEWMSSYPL
ncbi:glycosyltransferase [Paenibacillus sp. PL91]|uniref:glycosyltransferase n=1 Tax=Paenibacillus sp. PL91 TaxID=2729538 RepID=UPI00145F8981|nr:glycosyltransferase [Paenibacillus sp. PL91]MBC9203022.1 glycosyltransferase [Paenibacillus sp. PL91]